MQRGEVVLVDLDPARSGEADKLRPAVVVSNDGANTTAARLGRGVVTVVPLSTSVDRVYPFQVLVPAGDAGLEQDSKAQAEQVRSISVDRVTATIGRIPIDRMIQLDEALRLHLAL
jgi:mRNA interferase MazF